MVTLINQKNFECLANLGSNAYDVGYSVSLLHRADPELLSQNNFELLVESGQNALETAQKIIENKNIEKNN